jgi:hypothetical protein
LSTGKKSTIAEVGAAEPAPTPALFQHDVRREGRVVASLRGVRTADGVTVETEVYPLTHAVGDAPIPRPFSFATADQARRFVDEALVAFEYLGCAVI